jgi:FMN phosphatase YigB (HAD superfamily)
MTVIVDFDRVVADTNTLKDDAMHACVKAGLCTEKAYREAYAKWSSVARNTDAIADMSPEDQKITVSWAEGFVSQLAQATGADEAQLRDIHRDALTRVKAFEGVLDVLRKIPKEDLYIVTAGGETDQNMKLHAVGIGDFVLHEHIAIVPVKDKETFETLFDYWKIPKSEQIIHINDRSDEFAPQIAAHERTICIQPLWGWDVKDRHFPQDAPPHFEVETVAECAMVLDDYIHFSEREMHPSGETGGKAGI